jgi:large conductance mechanosensitive channel
VLHSAPEFIQMLKGFRDFILRGNVVDLAVAVIIGAAFKTIVDKFVEGIVNPLLGYLVGKPNFDDALIVGPLKIGLVLTATLNFVLVAAVIYFLLIVPMNRMMKKEEPAPAPPPEPSAEEKLLTEIRDLLAKQ